MINTLGIFGLGFTAGFWLFCILFFPKMSAMTDAYTKAGESYKHMQEQINVLIRTSNENGDTMREWIELLQPISIEKQKAGE